MKKGVWGNVYRMQALTRDRDPRSVKETDKLFWPVSGTSLDDNGEKAKTEHQSQALGRGVQG